MDRADNQRGEKSQRHAGQSVNKNMVQIAQNTAAETANARIAELETSVAEYAAERAQVEEENKNNLIEKYAKVIDEEEISAIRAEVNNFSYSELESKLAISFANKHMAGSV